MEQKGVYVKTENGNTAHVLGDINMSEETAKAINKLIDVAYKTGLGDLNKTQQNKMENKELSFGERMVGIEFNPSNDDKVFQVKTKYAELFNLVQSFGTPNSTYEFNLVRGHAFHELINSQMAVVKLITFPY